MKAIILSSLIFFSLRAMSTEVGQKMKPDDCVATASTDKREPKKVVVTTETGAQSDDKKKVIGK
jgi:hypothetical protein